MGLLTHRERRSYDHRIKAQVAAAGDPNLFLDLEIPRSTAMSWIRRGVGEIVALDGDTEAEAQLRDRTARLEHRVSMLTAVLRFVLALRHLLGYELAQKRSEARSRRVEENRKTVCSNCPQGGAAASEDIAA